MVEVFKTNVADITQALVLTEMLQQHMPLCRITFDLEDGDKVLRVEGIHFLPTTIMGLLRINGYNCSLLD